MRLMLRLRLRLLLWLLCWLLLLQSWAQPLALRPWWQVRCWCWLLQ